MLSTADDRDPAATWEVASHGRRLAGYAVDCIVFYIFATAALTMAQRAGWLPPPPVADPPPQDYVLQLLLLMRGMQLLYYFFFEALTYRTPGKMLCQTRVMRVDGDDPGVGTIVARTLVRLVPFEEFSFLGALNGGWHDRWTGTCVVRRVDGLEEEGDPDDVY